MTDTETPYSAASLLADADAAGLLVRRSRKYASTVTSRDLSFIVQVGTMRCTKIDKNSRTTLTFDQAYDLLGL